MSDSRHIYAHPGRRVALTPPPGLKLEEQKQATTPQRSIIIGARLIADKLGIHISRELLTELTGVSRNRQAAIIASGQLRTFHNSGCEIRGRTPAFTKTDVVAIGAYLDDPTVSLEDRGKPWLDIVQDSGVTIPKTTHLKPMRPSLQDVTNKTVQVTMYKEGFTNAICMEEKLLTATQAKECLEFTDWELPGEENIGQPPTARSDNTSHSHSKDWIKHAYCDEFHFGIRSSITPRVTRRIGHLARDAPRNVVRKSKTRKDAYQAAREEDPMGRVFSVSVIIDRDFRYHIYYDAGNKVGKMTIQCMKRQILPAIAPILKEKGLTLVLDKDSAHTSKSVTKAMDDLGISYLLLPGVSPDLSIAETLARPLKRLFYARQVKTQTTARARFERVFYGEMSEKTVENAYKHYAARFYDVQRANGQMTKH